MRIVRIVETDKPIRGFVPVLKQAWKGDKKGRTKRLFRATQKYVLEELVKTTIPKV